VLAQVLLRARTSGGRTEPSVVADLVDAARKILYDVGEAFVGHGVDGFDLHGPREARCLAQSRTAACLVGGIPLAGARIPLILRPEWLAFR
jgi:hypothetical protein